MKISLFYSPSRRPRWLSSFRRIQSELYKKKKLYHCSGRVLFVLQSTSRQIESVHPVSEPCEEHFIMDACFLFADLWTVEQKAPAHYNDRA